MRSKWDRIVVHEADFVIDLDHGAWRDWEEGWEDAKRMGRLILGSFDGIRCFSFSGQPIAIALLVTR